ncbi:hypothetical protein DRN39_07470 [Thermococci archaeon]|nr:MAG: hypothetical protein DRN39_07470 [Thermococci archaeon]
MRKVNNNPDNIPLHFYKELVEIIAKGRKASYKVLQENKRLGIPTPFSLQGVIYYLMPDGRIVRKRK